MLKHTPNFLKTNTQIALNNTTKKIKLFFKTIRKS